MQVLQHHKEIMSTHDPQQTGSFKVRPKKDGLLIQTLTNQNQTGKNLLIMELVNMPASKKAAGSIVVKSESATTPIFETTKDTVEEVFAELEKFLYNKYGITPPKESAS